MLEALSTKDFYLLAILTDFHRMNFRPYRRILLTVMELHMRGFQRLRIAPGLSGSGHHWRCSITPVTNISRRHGARMLSWDTLAAHYTSANERIYFGWNDVTRATPRRLADLFIERFAEIARAGTGSDWPYAGWYLEMLGLTYPDSLPIAYADWEMPVDYLPTVGARHDIRVPLPPGGLGSDHRDDVS